MKLVTNVVEMKPSYKVSVRVRFDVASVVEAITEAQKEFGKEVKVKSYNYFGDIYLIAGFQCFGLIFYNASGYREFVETFAGTAEDFLALLDFRKDNEV